MSVDSLLDGAFIELLGKARQERDADQQIASVRPATINFEWTGGGAAIVLAQADPILVEVPFDCYIVWAHLYAGDAAGNPIAVAATVDLRLTQLATFGVSTLLSGIGTAPQLALTSSADHPVTGWQANLITGDAIIARLATYVGLATWLTLTLQVRPTDVSLGVTTVVNNAGTTMVDQHGNVLVFRS